MCLDTDISVVATSATGISDPAAPVAQPHPRQPTALTGVGATSAAPTSARGTSARLALLVAALGRLIRRLLGHLTRAATGVVGTSEGATLPRLTSDEPRGLSVRFRSRRSRLAPAIAPSVGSSRQSTSSSSRSAPTLVQRHVRFAPVEWMWTPITRSRTSRHYQAKGPTRTSRGPSFTTRCLTELGSLPSSESVSPERDFRGRND